jgi:hypothetical protein
MEGKQVTVKHLIKGRRGGALVLDEDTLRSAIRADMKTDLISMFCRDGHVSGNGSAG